MIGMTLLSEKILVFYHNDFEQMPICMPSKEQNKEKDSIIHTTFQKIKLQLPVLLRRPRV